MMLSRFLSTLHEAIVPATLITPETRMSSSTSPSVSGGHQYPAPAVPARPAKGTTFTNPILGTSYEVLTPCPVNPTEFSMVVEGPTGIVIKEFANRLPKIAHSVIRRVRPEAFVDRVLPKGWIQPGARLVAAVFWAWICILDVLSDDPLFDWKSLIETLSKLASSPYSGIDALHTGLDIVTVFCQLVKGSRLDTGIADFTSTRIESWKAPFYREVINAISCVRDGKDIKRRRGLLDEWAELGLVRLTVRPFMVLARASLGHEADIAKPGSGAERLWSTLLTVEREIQNIVNIQGDILGWIKDFADQNTTNLIEMEMKKDVDSEAAFNSVLSTHNQMVLQLLDLSRKCEDEQLAWVRRVNNPTRKAKEEFRGVNVYTGVAVGFGYALICWIQLCGLHKMDISNAAFPETITRAKYKALAIQEEFEELMGLSDA